MAASEPTDAQWAWVAGLFEGEGCISFAHRTAVRLDLVMTDRDVVEALDRLVPSPNGAQEVDPPSRPEHWSVSWRWTISREETVRLVLEHIYPWMLSRRRERIDEALARLDARHVPKPQPLHCPHGHAFSPANIYVTPAGHRACRTCRNRASREYQERRAAGACE